MKSKKSPEPKTAIDIVKISFGRLVYHVLGTTPLVINQLAEKARHELLFPALKKNSAGRATSLKHHPIEEFRSSLYQTELDSAPTRVFFPGSAFASVVADTAVDIPGSSRAQIERLTKVTTQNISIYGLPRLFMEPVRTAGPNKTPDIRTRALLPEWCCQVEMTYVRGLITERSITNLFAAGGVIGGVGDGRRKMGFGSFSLVAPDNKDFLRIMKTQGRIAQDKAIQAAEPWNARSAELLSWFKLELITREKGQLDDEAIPMIRSGNHEEEEELV